MLPTYVLVYIFLWAGWLSWYSNWLQTGWSRDQILVGTRFSAPVQIGPGAYPAFCTMGTGSFPGAKSGRGVTLTTHPLLMSWWRKSRAIPLLPLWAVQPVQSLCACTTVHFTFFFYTINTDRHFNGHAYLLWHNYQYNDILVTKLYLL